MKKQILGLAVVLFMGSAVCMAQDNRGGRPDMSKRIEQMVTDLGLNETQAKEFKAVMDLREDREEGNKKLLCNDKLVDEGRGVRQGICHAERSRSISSLFA